VRRHPLARINNAGAAEMTANVIGGTEVNDFIRAGVHTELRG
jgi:hypothetical protein